jgi:hypothetical protein
MPNSQARSSLKTIPSVVQLPGGVKLKGLPFKIVEYHPDGRPKTFELLEPGQIDLKAEGSCFLFADEDWIRRPVPGKAADKP